MRNAIFVFVVVISVVFVAFVERSHGDDGPHPPDPMPQVTSCLEIELDATVDPTKPGGNQWDVPPATAPDVAFSVDGIWTGPCEDSYTCSRSIKLKKRVVGEVAIEIWDIDLKYHDRVGVGRLAIDGAAHRIGSAVVTATCKR